LALFVLPAIGPFSANDQELVMKLPFVLIVAAIAQIYPAQACSPAFVPLEKRRSDSPIVFQGKIINTRTVERDFVGWEGGLSEGKGLSQKIIKGKVTLGTVKVTRVIKGKVPDTFVVSHPATRETSCDHVGTLEYLQKEGTIQEFTLGRNDQDVEPEPRVDIMMNMWDVQN